MSNTFHYGVPRLLIYSIHIFMGLWIAFIGYSLTQKRKLYTYEKISLIVLGTIAILYQAWLWIKFPKDNYAYNVPGWLLHLCHILIGAFFISVAVLKKPPPLLGALTLVIGSMAVLYMMHLLILGNKKYEK